MSDYCAQVIDGLKINPWTFRGEGSEIVASTVLTLPRPEGELAAGSRRIMEVFRGLFDRLQDEWGLTGRELAITAGGGKLFVTVYEPAAIEKIGKQGITPLAYC